MNLTLPVITRDTAQMDVFAFEREHPIGSICRPGCEWCSCTETSGSRGQILANAPLLIVGVATFEDWRQRVIAEGGPDMAEQQYAGDHFYFVMTD